MKKSLMWLPLFLFLIAIVVLALHGPIFQLAHYHEFFDQSSVWGIPHAGDVLSNVGFLLVAVLSFWSPAWHTTDASRWGYRVFVLALLMTSVSSSYYHWAPDDTRLFWDRLSIALACAGLVAAVRADTVLLGNEGRARSELWGLILFAVLTVLWWAKTADLRPYLLLQIGSLCFIPLWQTLYPSPAKVRYAFALAILIYVLAKWAEVQDVFVAQHLQLLSGHSLKHLLAAFAAGLILFGAEAKPRDVPAL